MADLTRFDFHAKKFYFSEDVQIMSAEEVGQYLLLLVAAWLGGKDASLPDSPVLLARMARVSTVSELVLAKFPVVETEYGPRRRNETLYGEWTAAVKRVEEGKQNADKRWQDRQPSGDPVATQKKSDGVPVLMSSPVQAGSGPVRPGSSPAQVTAHPNEKAADASDLGAAAPDPAQAVDFRHFRRLWHGKDLVIGRDKHTVARYEEACHQFGAGRVHIALDKWATDGTKQWMRDNNIREPFSLFLKQLEKTIERMSEDKTCDPVMVESAAVAENIPDAITSPEIIRTVDDVILRLAADEQRHRDERAARAKTDSKKETEEAVDIKDFLGE
jgi:uncharacterized protein YdaU (DUF1376 family)